MRLTKLILSLILFSLLASCGSSKKLKENELLFDGTILEFMDEENIVDKEILNEEIKLNLIDKEREYVFKHNMSRKTKLRLENFLIGSGYLKSSANCYPTGFQKKVKLKCELTLNRRYVIDSVFYPADTLLMTKTLRPMYSIDFLKQGDYFHRKNILKERASYVEVANNNGFPFFNKDDLLYVVDTTRGDYKVNIHIQIKPTTDSTKYKRYRYGKFYINPNFSLSEGKATDTTKMERKELFKISSGYDFISEKALKKSLYVSEGTIYNKSKNTITSNRLLNLGLFKFVNIQTRVNRDRTIDHYFNLTPYKMQSITGEIDINNRSGNFWGMNLKTSYTNKNLFNGAERLDLSATFGLETLLRTPFINTSDIGVEAALTMPSIVLPFKPFRTFRSSLPRTSMSMGFNHQRRINFYTYVSANAKYGFRWNDAQNRSQFWVPLDLQWFKLLNTTAEFDSIIAQDPRLAQSFLTTFVLGTSYEYIYNKKSKYNPLNQIYFKGTFESSGNIYYLLSNAATTFLGTPYAQYLRLTLDLRKYWALKRGSIASRLVLGSAFAFGNSTEVPYAKQYSVGGTNDLRAFPLRRIGPGTFVSPNIGTNPFLDQTGDIKIQANVEYRFPIYGIFKGAFFVDAGNVWLYQSDTRPEGEFKINTFYDQIAVGTGFSLRIDVDYFVVRAFAAFPIRNLKDTGNFEWVIDEIDFTNSTWISDNLQFNLGFGYPF